MLEAFSIILGRREITFCEGLCTGNARVSNNHRTGELAAVDSENPVRAPSIRRGKVSPWWEKVFLPWN